MSQEKETGIVLSRKDSGEADNICSIYTKNSGKEKFIFRGLKKSGKRPRTASEPGSVLNMIFYTGNNGNFNTISEFDLLNNNSSIRKSSHRIFSLFYILELVDLTTGMADPNMKIFNLLSAGIETLAQTPYVKHFTVFFTVKYLLLQGVFPGTEQCSWCGTSSPEKLVLENQGFKISCIDCSDSRSPAVFSRGIEFINQCVKLKLDKIDCSRYSENEVHYILINLINYIQHYYNINMKTESMLVVC